jgi:hypothetical protein
MENLEYMCHRADIQIIWAHCDLKWSNDGLLKKVKTDNGRQVIAKLKLLLDLTQIISS